jgi:flagellar biogenesis protein FliO
MAQNPQSGIDYLTYFIMLAILIILAIILWIIKKKSPKLPVKKDISMGVLIQKPIDAKNKIVLYEFNKRKYLLLIGNTNILLDVFDENMINISSKREFDEFLENHKIDEVKKYIKNAEELKEFDERI